MSASPEILWEATPKQKLASHLHRFMQWLENVKGLHFTDYPSLYEWSVKEVDAFWRYFIEYTKVFEFDKEQPVLSYNGNDFIGAKWFDGVSLNYAEFIFRSACKSSPAIVFSEESSRELVEYSWDTVYSQVASLAAWMKQEGIKKGDRVVSVLPNIPENVVAFLATQSIGAVWSSCSPDFGNDAIVQRFAQVEPVLLIATNQTTYNGNVFDKTDQINYLQINSCSMFRMI